MASREFLSCLHLSFRTVCNCVKAFSDVSKPVTQVRDNYPFKKQHDNCLQIFPYCKNNWDFPLAIQRVTRFGWWKPPYLFWQFVRLLKKRGNKKRTRLREIISCRNSRRLNMFTWLEQKSFRSWTSRRVKKSRICFQTKATLLWLMFHGQTFCKAVLKVSFS